MKEIQVQEKEAGQRLDKFLRKYFPSAPDSFLYKMLRKKNIVLNGKKAEGKEQILPGDRIRLYLSSETIDQYRKDPKEDAVSFQKSWENAPDISSDIVYEDAHILAVNKPVGLLSQKAAPQDVSLVESVTAYLLESGQMTEEDLCTFHPAVCNRLDRNTSGLVLAGKTLKGLQIMSKLIRKRALSKQYLCLIKGQITEEKQVHGWLIKDASTNRVTVSEKKPAEVSKGSAIETAYKPLAWNGELTLLMVHLITGKTHQIRAQLALEGHPLIGDYKYGDRKLNENYRQNFGIETQLLHAYKLHFPIMQEPLLDLSEKTLTAAVPDKFYAVIKETLWEHGTQEALEVLHSKK